MRCSRARGGDSDLVELLAGVPYRVPKHRTVLQDGRSVRIDYGKSDHCCGRFALADERLQAQGLQAESCVGHACARLVRARDIAEVALEHLAHDPLLFLQSVSAGCAECDEAQRSIVA